MKPTMVSRSFSLRRLTQRLARDRRGVAAIEFGIVAPIMVALWFSLVQVTQGIMVHRKVSQLSRTLADLTSQVTSVSTTELDNIFNAARAVMMPFTDATPKMSIASVVIDSAGTPRICWVEARGSSIGTVGSVFDLPATQRIPNTSLIVAHASYDYTSQLGPPLAITIDGGRVFMSPRRGAAGGASGAAQVQRGTTMC